MHSCDVLLFAMYVLLPLITKVVLFAAPTMSASGYSTLGRPVSLPVAHQPHHRSSSDPDLPGSNPGSPDAEVAALIGE